MDNHEQLVKALRHCATRSNGCVTCAGCPMSSENGDVIECINALHKDAAAAIEELLPKRGEWIDGDARKVTARCSVCNHLRLGNGAEWANKHVHFCEVCGSRMGDEKA